MASHLCVECSSIALLCVQVRDEEMEELETLLCNFCELPAAGGVENGYGKINILLQTYIGRGEVDNFSLISDLAYVAQVSDIHTNTHCISILSITTLCRVRQQYSTVKTQAVPGKCGPTTVGLNFFIVHTLLLS